MTQSSQPGTQKSIFEQKDLVKSHEILTCTIKAPSFSFAHLEAVSDGSNPIELDDLQVKSFCTAALRQFLGITGAAISVDIMKVEKNECWVRVPRSDLGPFTAAVTAWRGTVDSGSQTILRIKQCSDWLGTIIGSDDQDRLWNE